VACRAKAQDRDAHDIEPFQRLPKTARGDAEEEGDALLRFLEPEAERFEVAFAP
jgi:hypothetical protein